MARTLLLLFLLQTSVLLANDSACVITLVPENDTFTQWHYDWRSREGFTASVGMQFTPPFRGTMEFAACSTLYAEKKWRSRAYPGNDFLSDVWNMTGSNYGGSLYFPASYDVSKDVYGDGTFLFAVLVDGVRRSNVIRVTIKHNYDAKQEPPLRVFAIQPLKGDSIQQLGVWVVPAVLDKKLTNYVASAVDLSIDGHWHTTQVGMWDGMVYPLPAGKSAQQSCSFPFYTPPILPFRHAKVQARLLDFISAETDISFDSSDATQFDKAFGL